ncbi:hypothetical protein D3C84_551200 [compost metagenome]
MGFNPSSNIFRCITMFKGTPTRTNNINGNQDLMLFGMDENITFTVILAFVNQIKLHAIYFQRFCGFKCKIWYGQSAFKPTFDYLSSFDMGYISYFISKNMRRSNMVSMPMAVDEVGHWFVGYISYGVHQFFF